MHPRANRRKHAVKFIAARVKLQLRAVIDVICPHRPHNRQIIDAIADVRPPIADFDSALAAFAVTNLQRIQLRQNLSQVWRRGTNIRIEKRLVQHRFEWRFGD